MTKSAFIPYLKNLLKVRRATDTKRLQDAINRYPALAADINDLIQSEREKRVALKHLDNLQKAAIARLKTLTPPEANPVQAAAEDEQWTRIDKQSAEVGREYKLVLHDELANILSFAKTIINETLLPETIDRDRAEKINPPIETVTVIQLLNFLITNREEGYFKTNDLYRKYNYSLNRLMAEHPHDLLRQIADLTRTYYQKNTGSPKSVAREEIKRSLKYAGLIVEKNITDKQVDVAALGRELETYPQESKVIYAFCLFLRSVRRIVGPTNEKEYVHYLNVIPALLEQFPDEMMDAFKNLSRLLK